MSEKFDTDDPTLNVHEGTTVFDVTDDKVGTVDRVLRDPAGAPTCISVTTGILGSSTIVPLDAAHITESGVWVPYTRDAIKSAPNVEGDELTPEENARVHEHFNLVPSSGGEGKPAPDHERLDASTSGVEGAADSVADDADAAHSPAHSDDQGITDVTTPHAEEQVDRSELDDGTIDGNQTPPVERVTPDQERVTPDQDGHRSPAGDGAEALTGDEERTTGSTGSTAAGQQAADGGPDIRL
ncbi:hypothetical protein GCM10022261_03570 [Brevibacterium daeguense]|uniref:PRC-barrel domain-containing protein n=1 Tax=Brevibacterium daeguense TaxID=909936 RepID=A0ABP8EG51_9MICO|nr:hypothetical protein [Brevibacterium daeguense]